MRRELYDNSGKILDACMRCMRSSVFSFASVWSLAQVTNRAPYAGDINDLYTFGGRYGRQYAHKKYTPRQHLHAVAGTKNTCAPAQRGARFGRAGV